ncbi:DUF2262 domain-containing protein [Hanstruepera ponticola]|uniref:DUF2262 domain-containing protein n=1 Tax=Hanstruepera ponticola TaxID=2042995 RepID=UPI00177FDFB5|nr:DUF2262 domain-containing protein [Hanstruepera ponticola]
MGIFSRFKKKGNINLSKSDFKTESEDFEVLSVKLSGDFFEKFPQAKKKDSYTGKSKLITNTATLSLFGNNIKITYDPSEIELNEDKFIDQMNRNLNWIADNESGIKNGITKKLLTLKNENWLEENESELSESEFIKRIKLTSISFFGEGNSELIFDDGDLFWEHEIVAVLNTKNKLTEINIRG